MSSAAGAFEPSLVQRLAGVEIVQLETPRRDGSTSSRPVWIVVVGAVPYLRSYLGRRGVWWRRVVRDGRGVLVVDGEEVRFAARLLAEDELRGELNRSISRAYEEKYGGRSPQPTRVMVGEEVAGTTVCLTALPEPL